MQPKEGGATLDYILRGGGLRDEYACFGVYGEANEDLMRTNFEDFRSGNYLKDPNTALTQPLKPLPSIRPVKEQSEATRREDGTRKPSGIEVANSHGMFVSLSLSLSLSLSNQLYIF